ncbi:MAG: PQQ-dependent sugar dehydrogenase [Gammaproteobacteria bacterium]
MKLRAIPIAILAAGLFGCGGGGGGGGGNPPPPPPPPPASGLDVRPNNQACVAPDRATGTSTVSAPRVFPNLAFSAPVALLQAPGDATRWFVVQQGGRIRVFDATNPAVATAPDFLNITTRVTFSGEAGLLGLAFHPDFPADPRAFVNYIRTSGGQLQSVTSEFRSPDNGLTLDPNSERILLTVDKFATNHNGGNLAFGPDDFLYVGLGDGGGGGDPQNNGQNPMRLLGKMLRIDIDSQPGGQPYGVPADNPFAGNNRCNANGSGAQNCPEIYALGLRNPWRWSFDRQTDQLWLADVGQNSWEEIDVIVRAGNYGWRIREGAHCFNPSSGCQTAGLIDPVAEYGRALGASITGGYVYRGTQTTELFGRYLFADFVSGMIASLTPAGASFTITQHVPPGGTPPGGASGPLSISSFGESVAGELFVLDYGSGQIRQLMFTGAGTGDNVPQQLSQTGCINTTAAGAPPLLSLIPYRPNAQFWSDGAAKERWIGLPNGVNIAVPGDGDWDLPNRTVLVKHFRLNNQLVETRLFMRHPDGVWAGYTFEWNPAQTDALRVTGGKTVRIGGQDYVFPSEGQCIQCHTQAAGSSLGLETAQLNGNHLYPQTGRTANQITTLNAINALSPPVGANPPAYADPADTTQSLGNRARAYLHTNCANCHRPGGGTPVAIDLRHGTPLAQTGTCDVVPTAGDLGIANARIIAPGDDTRSVLLARMARRGDAFQMPPVSSTVRDAAGEQLIGVWIDSLTFCQ